MPKTASDTQRVSAQACAVEGCEGQHKARGYCHKHYQRWRKCGDPLKVVPLGRPPRVKPLCMVDGCEGKHEARGFCNRHYLRWQRRGDPHKIAQPQTADSPLCREDFGSRIRAARLAAGLTQWTVAGRAGLSNLTVVQVEGGTRTRPRLSTLKGFAGALGIPLSELLARPNSTALEND
jgi:DNA-binding XRE family transcriptional regulator